MKKLFYILIGLVLIPVALNAQGTLSLKQIYDNLTTNYYTKTASDGKYATSADVSGKADKTYVDANFATTAENALKQNISDMVDYYTKTAADLLFAAKANRADVYTTGEIDLKFLNHYTTQEIDLKFTNYYTSGEVDAKLLLKLDASAITLYYNKNEIDQLLLDKAGTDAVALKADKSYVDENFATTGAVGLKANSADVFTTQEINLMLDDKADTSSVTTVAGDLANHTAEVAAHGRKSPVGQAANVIEVTDGLGGWTLTPIAAASGSVTQAVDLVVDSSTFSRIMNPAAINAQAALAQIEANAATTAEVAAKANSADVYTKTAADAVTSEEVSVHNGSATAHANRFANYSDTDAMNAAIAAATAECQFRYWYPANMANGDYTGEVIVATVSTSQTQYNAVYMKSDGWAAAKADAYTTLPAIGIILEAGTGSKKVLTKGIVKNTSWSFTQGARVYVSAATAGAITTTAPSTTGQLVQIIGIALSADTLYVCPDSTCVEN